jgi:hypothetical protein
MGLLASWFSNLRNFIDWVEFSPKVGKTGSPKEKWTHAGGRVIPCKDAKYCGSAAFYCDNIQPNQLNPTQSTIHLSPCIFH